MALPTPQSRNLFSFQVVALFFIAAACGGKSIYEESSPGASGTTGGSGQPGSGGRSPGAAGTTASSGGVSSGSGGVGSAGTVSVGGSGSGGRPATSGGAFSGGNMGIAGTGPFGGSGGFGGAIDCAIVQIVIGALRAQAQACSPDLPVVQCGERINDGCGCPFPVQDAASPAVFAYQAALLATSSQCSQACPDACDVAMSTVCAPLADGSGHCSWQH